MITSRKRNAMWALFMRESPTSEQGIVLRCIGLQVVSALVAILYAYIHTNFILHSL
jgi:hypothetical protein